MRRIQFKRMAACAALMLSTSGRCVAQDEPSFQKILQQRAPSIVTLRIVSKVEGPTGGQGNSTESRSEIQGVVVDKDGLIMVSNVFLNPYSLSLGGQNAQGFKMTPTSIKVLFADDDREYPAFLAATDTKLNLAFIKVEDLAGKAIVPVEFTSGATAAIGQRLLSVSRMSRGFDYSPYIQSAHISGEVVRPRRAWALDVGGFPFGLPVFTSGGELVGVATTIPSSIKEDMQNPDMGMMVRMLTGGGYIQSFVVVASTVDAIINQAKASAVEAAAKHKAGQAVAAAPAAAGATKKSDATKKPVKPKTP